MLFLTWKKGPTHSQRENQWEKRFLDIRFLPPTFFFCLCLCVVYWDCKLQHIEKQLSMLNVVTDEGHSWHDVQCVGIPQWCKAYTQQHRHKSPKSLKSFFPLNFNFMKISKKKKEFSRWALDLVCMQVNMKPRLVEEWWKNAIFQQKTVIYFSQTNYFAILEDVKECYKVNR